MTITIKLGSWMIPAAVTAIAILGVCWTAYQERDDRGLFAGMGTVLATVVAFVASAIAWITWAGTHFIK